MKFVPAVFLPLILIAASGCKGPDAQVVGTWEGPQSSTLTFKADHTFEAPNGAKITGTWKIDGHELAVTPTTYMGKPMSELKAQLEKTFAATHNDQIKKIEDRLDKPDMLVLSDDGKTLTADKTKNPDQKVDVVFHKKTA